MEVPVVEIKAIASTLPIGLYAKRRIPVVLEEKLPTSYYNMVTDEIVISCDIIQQGLKHVKNTTSVEKAVRSMLYHEVSHAILTPRTIKATDWFNIFEDERIERIFNHYYLDTDFKQQLLDINGFDSIADVPTDATGMQKFYTVVRFGVGEKQYVDRVTEIIKKASNITCNTDSWDSYEYVEEVRQLYKDITGETPPAGRATYMMSPSFENGDVADGADVDKVDITVKNITDDSEKEDGEMGKPSEEIDGDILSKEKVNELVSDVLTNKNKYLDTKLTEQLSIILEKFSKKNNSGSAVSGYSGTFNAKATVREDYKFFERKASINGTNKFGTFHLNLYIDKSGSFYKSEDTMNRLLHSLTEIEKKNQNFKLDVVFCGMGEKIVQDKRHRVFKTGGGNNLDKNIYDIYRQLQKPNTYNYNIACFDGDAYSDGNSNAKGFGAFDHANCAVISDKANARYINSTVKSAKVIYTVDYTEELIKNVIDALTKAFR